jgi:hypothetical protein
MVLQPGGMVPRRLLCVAAKCLISLPALQLLPMQVAVTGLGFWLALSDSEAEQGARPARVRLAEAHVAMVGPERGSEKSTW